MAFLILEIWAVALEPTRTYLRRVCELILELSIIDLDKALTLDDLY